MTEGILARIQGGHLPMHFFKRADVDRHHHLTDAGYLMASSGPIEPERRTSATVTGLTPLGRAAVRYLGRHAGSVRQAARS